MKRMLISVTENGWLVYEDDPSRGQYPSKMWVAESMEELQKIIKAQSDVPPFEKPQELR